MYCTANNRSNKDEKMNSQKYSIKLTKVMRISSLKSHSNCVFPNLFFSFSLSTLKIVSSSKKIIATHILRIWVSESFLVGLLYPC